MNDWWKQTFTTAVGGLVAGSVGIVVGLVMAGHHRKRNAKDAFLIKISQLRAKIEKRDVAGFYTSTKSELQDAVFSLHPFLNAKLAARLDKLWGCYNAIVIHEALKQTNENDWVQDLWRTMEPEKTPPKKPSEVLFYFFDKLAEVAA